MASMSAAEDAMTLSTKLVENEENEEVTSTTEETTSTAEADSVTSDSEGAATPETDEIVQIEVIPATSEEKQEALRHYGQHFGKRCKKSTLGGNRKVFHGNSEMQAEDSKPAVEVLAELDRDLAACQKATEVAPAPAPVPTQAKNEDELQPTFGYASGLDENPTFARFDVRDQVCLKVGGYKHGDVVRDRTGRELVVVGVKPVDGTDRLWFHPKDLGRPGAGAFRGVSQASLNMRVSLVSESEVSQEAPHFREMTPEEFEGAEDSDGEDMHLCLRCRLPVGERAFLYGAKKAPVHKECMEDLVRTDMKQQEETYKKKDDEHKQMDRKHYDIGWHVEEIPSNMIPAVQLGCPEVPQGSTCLVFNREAHTVTVAPTLDPSESMNLEYLSLALQVRLTEGREPLFSLDPVDPSNDWKKHSMQFKRFEPEWLAGTSVGEVMFQADYHLKELSMGEYAQPVVGMKSCFDFADAEGLKKEWSAREWFIVRKAEVAINDDNILVPRVRMGVEARELFVEQNELVDMKTTRPNHPMVKYAEAFTKNFDLIAERKSVIFHLRELAKASVVAKMLVEGDVNLYETWLQVARPARDFCPMEVPQLWNEREYAKVYVNEDGIERSEVQKRSGRHGIYGGVNFGLDNAGVTLSPLAVKRPAAGLSAVATGGLAGIATAGVRVAPAPAPVAISAIAPAAAAAPGVLPYSRPAVGLAAMAMPSELPAAALRFAAPSLAPLGVGGILNPMAPLKSVPVMPNVITLRKPALSLTAMTVPAAVTKPSIVVGQTRTMRLAALPALAFPIPPRPTTWIPPSTTAPIMAGEPRGVDLNLDQFNLSQPVPLEGGGWGVAQDVKCASIGSTFFESIDGPGSEFSATDKKLLRDIYNPSLCDRRMEGEQFVPPDTSYDYVQKLRVLVEEEELCRQQRRSHFFSSDFSVASPGPLFPTAWLPTVQITKGVDSPADELHPRPDYMGQAHRLDGVLKSTTPVFDKCTEGGTRFCIYHVGSLEVRTIKEPAGEEVVGAVFSRGEDLACIKCGSGTPVEEHEKIIKATEYIEKTQDGRNSYIVLETERHDIIVTEKLLNGAATWVENPSDLEDRNALAKLVRTQDCKGEGVNVRFMRTYQRREGEHPTASRSKCKNYAQGMYARAVGITNKQCGGFYKCTGSSRWQLSEEKYGLHAAKQSTGVEAAPTKTEEVKRLSVGDKVEVKASGRSGQISVDERGELPYKVVFSDGKLPKAAWCKESDVNVVEA